MIVKTEKETFENVKSLEMISDNEEMDVFFHGDRKYVTIKVKDIISIEEE